MLLSRSAHYHAPRASIHDNNGEARREGGAGVRSVHCIAFKEFTIVRSSNTFLNICHTYPCHSGLGLADDNTLSWILVVIVIVVLGAVSIDFCLGDKTIFSASIERRQFRVVRI